MAAKPRNPGGRGAGSKKYTHKQLEIIKDAHRRGLSRRKILSQYPQEGFAEGGVGAAIARIKRTGEANPAQRQRQRSVRTEAKVAEIKKLVEDDPSIRVTTIAPPPL